jgi:hypothetical protein
MIWLLPEKGRSYFKTLHLGPVHPVKKSAKNNNRVHSVGGGGGKGTTQVYPDDGLKILLNN